MTKFMKLELKRLVTKLPEVDPTTSDYHVLLRSIEFLDGMGQTIEAILDEVFQPDEDGGGGAGDSSAIEPQPLTPVVPFPTPADPVPVPAPIVPPTEPANNPVTESTDSPAAEGETTTEAAEAAAEAEPERTWTAAEVRKAVVDARMKQGVDTKALFQKFGAATFQGIPASKYAELMRELGVTE